MFQNKDQTRVKMQSIKDIFSALFFVRIGYKKSIKQVSNLKKQKNSSSEERQVIMFSSNSKKFAVLSQLKNT